MTPLCSPHGSLGTSPSDPRCSEPEADGGNTRECSRYLDPGMACERSSCHPGDSHLNQSWGEIIYLMVLPRHLYQLGIHWSVMSGDGQRVSLAITGAQEPVLVFPSWPSHPAWQELVNQLYPHGPMPGLWALVESKLNVLEIV